MSGFRELEASILRAMQSDRFRLRNRLRSIQQASKAGKPFDRNLSRLTTEIEKSVSSAEARRSSVPKISFDDTLPITSMQDEIRQAIADHQVIIVCGETGSGKSTQLPKLCLQMGRGITGMIGHTQPRRIAARSVAARVAEELGTPLGQQVGFKIRFTDVTSPSTFIKLMTDGILLAESQNDRFFDAYDTLIIDEAHERSLNIDFLLGLLKRLLPKRRDLRVIITSATIDAARFSEHFATAAGPAPVVEVSGRAYPVELRYRPVAGDEDAGEPDWQRAVADAVDELAAEEQGDILIFMPTERDIRDAAQVLRGRRIPGDHPGRTTEILPLYARLSTAEQNRVFKGHAHRRIVIATNVAESSLTVPGIRSVIDPGTARISRYSARSKVQRLPIEPISQASADQRKGRCGRIGPGICIRLYSEQDYESRERFTAPEIQRTNLAAVILQTITLKLGAIEDFPFLDPPKPTAIREGYNTLYELGAIDAHNALTPIGRRLSQMPVDPRVARMILSANEESCLNEVLIIASALEIRDPRERPIEKQQAADKCHVQFQDETSDFLSYVKLWDFFHNLRDQLSQSKLRAACRQNFLSYNRLREWIDVHRQLQRLVEQAGMKPQRRCNDAAAIHRALLSGLLANIAMRPDGVEFSGAGGQKLYLWPGSALFEAKPKWIMAAELVETSRRYARTVARIDPKWIEPLAMHLVKRSYSEPHWRPETGSAVAVERVSLFGLMIVPGRTVNYGPIDPVKSRELFIQHGLVEGEIEINAEFFRHNQQLLEEAEALQAKSRRHDLLLGEDARYEFYDRRIPADVFDGVRFRKWRKRAESRQPRLLFMTQADVLREGGEAVAGEEFPDALAVDRLKFPLEYRLEPGSEEDGVTLTIPREGLVRLSEQRLGWLVPGLLEQKIIAMIKSLPKDKRRAFVPAPDTARQVMAGLRFGQGDFRTSVAEALTRISGEAVSPSWFDGEKLPAHLRMNVRVVDGKGETLAKGRDLAELRKSAGMDGLVESATSGDTRWHRDGLTTWDFGNLPEKIVVDRAGLTLDAYPMLIDAGETAALRLADSAERAARETRGGVRRLFVLAAARELKSQVAHIPRLNQLKLYAATLPDAKRLQQHIGELIADLAFFHDKTLPRSEQAFQAQTKMARNRISLAVQDIVPLITPLLETYHKARVAIERVKNDNWKYAADDAAGQLAHLVRPGFLISTPTGWLLQYPRYFRAIVLRLERLAAGGIQTDQRDHARVEPLWQEFLRQSAVNEEQQRVDAALVHYGWMLEEFRVSVYAQKLGTAISVSDKRLAAQWAKVRH